MQKPPGARRTILSVLGGFLAGALLTLFLMFYYGERVTNWAFDKRWPLERKEREKPAAEEKPYIDDSDRDTPQVRPSEPETPEVVPAPTLPENQPKDDPFRHEDESEADHDKPIIIEPAPVPDRPLPPQSDKPGSGPQIITGNDIADLRKRNLQLPVQGLTKNELRDSFNEARGSSRKHLAIDILADRGTPVYAVEDGVVAKLWSSKPGGITLYHFDPTRTFAYYYAHLDKYAPNIKEGDPLKRGQVIGYVGTTGNAPPDTPHLHFAIFRLTEQKHWWEGNPVNPYEVLR